jgi:hypothetical protein
LKADTPLADLSVSYDPVETSMVDVTAGFTDYFKTLDPTNCPITSCNLFDSDCTKPYSGDNSKLKLVNSAPWKI